MEEKVIENVIKTNKKNQDFIYDGNYSLWKHEGSGNNWSYGYYHHGPSI